MIKRGISTFLGFCFTIALIAPIIKYPDVFGYLLAGIVLAIGIAFLSYQFGKIIHKALFRMAVK